MAGDWIKMRTNLDTDPAVVRISSGLKLDRFATVGRLHRIWAWANEHLTDGQNVPIDSDFLDQLVDCPGFSDAMRSVGWLSGRDGSLCFPSFERHNGASAKARAVDALRKKNVRKGSGKCPDATRTESGPEKRREEKSITSSLSLAKVDDKPVIPGWLAEPWSRWMAVRFANIGSHMPSIQQEQVASNLASRGREKALADLEFTILKGAKNVLDSAQDYTKKKVGNRNGSRKTDKNGEELIF